MIPLLFFLLLFAVLAAACIAGWSVDSRDSRFSLSPLNRFAPEDFPEPDARPLGVPKPPLQARDSSQSAALTAYRDTARRHLTCHAPAKRVIHALRPNVTHRHAAGHAVPLHPSAQARPAALS